jgi:hypothetical protein
MRNYINEYVQLATKLSEQSIQLYTGKVTAQDTDTIILEPFTETDSFIDWEKLTDEDKMKIKMFTVKFEVEIFIKNIVSISKLPKSSGYL